MASLYANKKYPNDNGWQDRHDSAVNAAPHRASKNLFETFIVRSLQAWEGYALAHKERYESLIGDDGVLGPAWEQIGDGLRTLLNGETGRLDCGTLDAFLLDTMSENGVDVEIN
jgi:hypothetical protein